MGQLSKTTVQTDKILNPSRISLYLPTPYTRELTLAGTWYKLEGSLTDGAAVDFTLRGTPDFDVVYDGISGAEIEFFGHADVSLSSPGGTLDFGLFRGETLVAKFNSSTNIAADTDIKPLGTAGLIHTINNGENFSIRAKCDQAGLDLTVENIKAYWKLVTV